MNDIVTKIIAFENGELECSEIAPFFQKLIDTGYINQLQGSYLRTAARLIHAGLCTPREVTR